LFYLVDHDGFGVHLPEGLKQIAGGHGGEDEDIEKHEPNKHCSNNRRVLNSEHLVVRKGVIRRHDIEEEHRIADALVVLCEGVVFDGRRELDQLVCDNCEECENYGVEDDVNEDVFVEGNDRLEILPQVSTEKNW
jgi:hypothetical protein